MSDQLLFTVTGSEATPADTINLAEAGLRERRDLQEWVAAHPEILGENVKIVTVEFDRWWSSTVAPADRLDILGLDSVGRLVVAELKRDLAPDTVEMQAIKYAAMASRFTPEALASQHARFLTHRGKPTSEDEALELLVAHGGELDPEVLGRPRIVLVAGDFPPVVSATAVWLTEMGIDMTLVRVLAYRTAHETLIAVSRFFPVKDVEEFMVTPRQAEARAVEDKRQRRRDASTTSRLITAQAIEDGEELHLRPEGINNDLRSQIDAWVASDSRRARAQWVNDQSGPMRWEADGQRYSPSGLAELVVRQATGANRSIRGGDWWTTEDGRDLVEIAQELSSARERRYFAFWSDFARRVREEHPDWIATRGQPSQRHWFEMNAPIRGASYNAAFMRGHRIKYELFISTGDAQRNLQVMDGLTNNRPAIERAFGGRLEWSIPGQSRQYAAVAAVGDGDVMEVENQEAQIDWLVQTGIKLRGAIEAVSTPVAPSGNP